MSNSFSYLQLQLKIFASKPGKTPLHFAASRGHVEDIRFLLYAGANIHEKDEVRVHILKYISFSTNANM
jgi:ankyrin repeat protein